MQNRIAVRKADVSALKLETHKYLKTQAEELFGGVLSAEDIELVSREATDFAFEQTYLVVD